MPQTQPANQSPLQADSPISLSEVLSYLSPALIFGFGLHWTWTFAAVYKMSNFFELAAGATHALMFSICLGALCLTLLGYAVFLERVRKLFKTAHQRRRNRIIGALCSSIGTLLLIFSGDASGLQFAFTILSGLLTGFGSAILLMSFGVSYSTCDSLSNIISFASSIIVSALLYVGLITADSSWPPISAILTVAAPLVECLCLNIGSVKNVDTLSFYDITLPVKTVPFALHICLPSLIYGIVLGLIRNTAIFATSANDIPGSPAIPPLLSSLLCGVVIAAALLPKRVDFDFSSFRMLTPVVAVLLASIVLTPQASDLHVSIAFCTSYFLLEACLWTFYATISQEYRISAFTSYGLGQGSLSLGTLIGCCGANSLIPFFASPEGIPFLVALAFVSIVLGSSLLPTRAELRGTLKRKAYCLLLNNEGFSADIKSPVLASIVAPPPMGITPSVAAQTQEPKEGESDAEAVVSTASATTASSEDCERNASQAPPAPKSGPRPAATKSVAGKHPERADAFKAKAPSGAAPTTGPSPSANESERQDDQQKVGRFKRRVLAVADNYLLSQRETEVLFLLAHGKNAAAIQEQLCISAGTVNTHMRHVYRKLDVHSQQELIQLIDGMEVEEA